MAADLLLLNASNYPRVPIFPYAFVQVTEVARRHGLNVRAHDLLGTAPHDVRAELRRLVEVHRPRMVGLHLRQLDSLFVDEYRGYDPLDASAPPFFPVAATEAVIRALRSFSDVPIVLGGHGFTSNPRSVFERLRPDFAITGEPDDFFARFGDVLARRELPDVANLVFGEHGTMVQNERTYFPPTDAREYTEREVAELERFYGVRALRSQTVPVEVMRGCPYRCSFCCEPAVKGRHAVVRDLDAVLGDIEFLGSHGLDRIWMVCSELNVFGADLAMELAERIVRLRERTGRRVLWHAFSLPVRMGLDVWRTLARAGFRGGFNTFMSLDDDNLRRGRIPHRAIDAIEEYRVQEQVAEELGEEGADMRTRGTLALFLGNSFSTVTTVRRSLRLLHEHGLLETARVPVVMSATRVFETLEQEATDAANERVSFGPSGAVEPDLTQPTFEYPVALVRHFGGRRAMESFFSWVETTILSRAHERTKDWPLFLANTTTRQRFAQWLLETGAPSAAEDRASALFFPDPRAKPAAAGAALEAMLELFRRSGATGRVLGQLELGSSLDAVLDAPILPLLESLWRFSSQDALLESLQHALGVGPDSLEIFFARFFLYRRNIVFDPTYRSAIFGDETAKEPVHLRVLS